METPTKPCERRQEAEQSPLHKKMSRPGGKQTGMLSFFKPRAPGESTAGAKPTMLSVGAEVLHLPSQRRGRITKLSRNAQGFVVASAVMHGADGGVVTGSPTVGKDFARAEDDAERCTSITAGRAAPPCPEGDSNEIEEVDDGIDLTELQRLEDAAMRSRDAAVPAPALHPPRSRVVSSAGEVRRPSPASTQMEIAAVLSPPTIKKSPLRNVGAPPSNRAGSSPASARAGTPDQLSAHSAQRAQPKSHWWWLEEKYVRDADKRRPDAEDFDASSVYIPPEAWQSMTDFQKQYWQIKKKNFDMLILAKLGKFYELYENDAEVAHRLLGLNYTHGGRDPNSKKMLCAGVPESSIDGIVGKLVAFGYKVGIVEEMERASDVKKAQATSSSARKVVVRSLRRIVTPGTMSDEELLGGYEPKPLVCLVPQLDTEVEAEKLADTVLGVCLVDCSTGRFWLGSVALHQLDVLLRTHRPHEVVYPRGRLCGMLKNWLKNSTPVAVWSALSPGHRDEEFWPADVARLRLAETFGDAAVHAGDSESRGILPHVLAKLVQDSSDEASLVLNALGGALSYLKKLSLDQDLLSLRNFQDLHGLGDNGPKCMLLDIQTLNGLDVLEPKGQETKGRSKGMTCLWHHLDRAVTPFGRRLLRWWVTRPLLCVEDIRARSAAVGDLLRISGPGTKLDEAEAVMKKLPDLERKVARIHACASACADVQGVAEGAASQKRAVRELVSVLSAFRQVDALRQLLHEVQEELCSSLLQDVIADIPNVSELVHELERGFDVEKARASDAFQLRAGYDEEYDSALHRIHAAEGKLQQLLAREKASINCPRLKFSGSGKDCYLLEMPADFPQRLVPAEYELHGQTKACRRYSTPALQRELDALETAKDELEGAKRRASTRVCVLFDSDYATWCRAVTRIAEFDALLALAKASESADGQPMVAAEILHRQRGSAPVLSVTNMRHPFLGGGAGGAFVPNNFELGRKPDGSAPASSCLILTGPNMGGKSTTLRLSCFAALLAQLGAYVPAEKCVLTPVDRIFTRLGADDDICRGLSTFLVEMKDVEVVLREATENSLVILDELGRGTSTFDGHAIAFAVLKDLLDRVRCRTLLSTHYHGLVQDFSGDTRIQPMHMACRLDPAAGQLVMLYKLQPGVCPQSYGMECGLRAGLPEHIITRARIKSAEFEAEQQSKAETHSFAAAAAAHGVESGWKRRRDDGDEELHTLQKARAILDVIPNGSQPLQGREALAVYRKLAEIWDSLAP